MTAFDPSAEERLGDDVEDLVGPGPDHELVGADPIARAGRSTEQPVVGRRVLGQRDLEAPGGHARAGEVGRRRRGVEVEADDVLDREAVPRRDLLVGRLPACMRKAGSASRTSPASGSRVRPGPGHLRASPIAALAVVEPRRDPRDGASRGARTGQPRDLRVVQPARASARPPNAGPGRAARRGCTGRGRSGRLVARSSSGRSPRASASTFGVRQSIVLTAGLPCRPRGSGCRRVTVLAR